MLPNREKHYQSLANYYSNLARLKRYRAVVHLEDKTDKQFWEPLFGRYLPGAKFHFISYSKSPLGNDTTGCEQCLAYRPWLNRRFVVCIDSDYRYLMQEAGIDIQHFIFQTYTYSFENHLCVPEGFDWVCKESCGIENGCFDYGTFLQKYSFLIYELFVWRIAFEAKGHDGFTENQFQQAISLSDFAPNIIMQGEDLLLYICAKVEDKLEELKRDFAEFNIVKVKESLIARGVTEENVFLYIRGHNLYALCCRIGKKVCDHLLTQERERFAGDGEKIDALFKDVKKFEDRLIHNIRFESYPEILKIKEDLEVYADMR